MEPPFVGELFLSFAVGSLRFARDATHSNNVLLNDDNFSLQKFFLVLHPDVHNNSKSIFKQYQPI